MNLKDQGGAHMFFDGSGNVVHNANNNSNKTVGNDKTDTIGNNKKLEVGCDHTADVGNTHKVDVGKGKSVFKMDNAGVIDLTGAEKITIKVGNSSIEISKTAITVKADTVNIEGISLTNVGKKAGNPGIVIDGNVTVKGAQVDIN
ncbi:bacteriophage T4 gp5 trimerisation domain-containing protein [Chryseobacterium tructae]